MPTLEEEISKLEEEIKWFRQEYANAATSEERKDNLLSVITATRQDITALRQQQQQLQGRVKKIPWPASPRLAQFTMTMIHIHYF